MMRQLRWTERHLTRSIAKALALVALVGWSGTGRANAGPSPLAQDKAQSVRLPSRSPLFVYQGGDTPNVNSHMLVQSQAYGVDLAVVGGPTGRQFSTPNPRSIEDFYCWNTEVVAPVTGDIVDAVDSLPDNVLGQHDTEHLAGNHVVIESAGVYYYVAHMRRGSVVVKAGAHVAAGQPIGRCGNSGNTDFPHIHLHATESPHLGKGTGINMTFGPMNVNLAGKQFPNVEWPLLRGLWVSSP